MAALISKGVGVGCRRVARVRTPTAIATPPSTSRPRPPSRPSSRRLTSSGGRVVAAAAAKHDPADEADTPPPPPPPTGLAAIAALLDAALLPRARGDARDCALMAAAVAGLVWASMGATRAYCAAYAAAGLRPVGRVLVEFLAGGGSGGF